MPMPSPAQQSNNRRPLVMPPSPLVLRKSMRGNAGAITPNASFAGPSSAGVSESPELTPQGSTFGLGGRARRLLSSMKTPREDHSPRRLFSKLLGSGESQLLTQPFEDMVVVVPEVDESSKMLKKVIESGDGIDSKRLFKQLIAIENLQF